MTTQRPGIEVSGTSSQTAYVANIRSHQLRCDDPVSLGGGDTGPTPCELLCAALGADLSTTIAAYARRQRWPLEQVRTSVAYHQERREVSDGVTRMVDLFACTIELVGPLDVEQRRTLLEVANMCPLQRTLTHGADVTTRLWLPSSRPPP